MKCPFCKKGNMLIITDSFKEDNINYEVYSCPICKEEILDMQQLKILAAKCKELRKATSFAKWGNSLAIRIPEEMVKELKIKPGSKAQITKEKGMLKITPC